jgi:hypothetical protein
VNIFRMTNNQEIADTTAFLLSFPGTAFTLDFGRNESQDSHAAVGKQFTLHAPQDPAFLRPFEYSDLVAHGVKGGLNRSWYYSYGDEYSRGVFQSDRHHEQQTLSELLNLAGPDTPLTFTVVPPGTGRRIGVDRDDDGFFDRAELDTGFDPADPLSHPPPIPVLSVEHSGNSIILSWSANSPGYNLYSAPGLMQPIDWQTSGVAVVETNGQFRATIVSTGSQFFRLQWR